MAMRTKRAPVKRTPVRWPNTRKFGNRRFALKWDSATFSPYHAPDSQAGIAEKKRMAKVWAKDYDNVNWESRITICNNGKDFKVWAVPR